MHRLRSPQVSMERNRSRETDRSVVSQVAQDMKLSLAVE